MLRGFKLVKWGSPYIYHWKCNTWKIRCTLRRIHFIECFDLMYIELKTTSNTWHRIPISYPVSQTIRTIGLIVYKRVDWQFKINVPITCTFIFEVKGIQLYVKNIEMYIVNFFIGSYYSIQKSQLCEKKSFQWKVHAFFDVKYIELDVQDVFHLNDLPYWSHFLSMLKLST